MIKQLLNSVIAKYRDLSVSRRSIICRSRRLRQIIDLLATDKSRYFAQPRPIITNSPQAQLTLIPSTLSQGLFTIRAKYYQKHINLNNNTVDVPSKHLCHNHLQ